MSITSYLSNWLCMGFGLSTKVLLLHCLFLRSVNSKRTKMLKMAFRGPVGERIREKLTQAFAPVYLEVLNESHMHSVPKNSETHFKIVCVSSQFEGKGPVENHRTVNALLKEELGGGVHALSLVLRTPAQWNKSENAVPQSPACRGGAKHEKQ